MDDLFDTYRNGRIPSAIPNLGVMDPTDPAFVPLAERSPRQQARFLVALKERPTRKRAFFTRAEERKAGPAKRIPLNTRWATED